MINSTENLVDLLLHDHELLSETLVLYPGLGCGITIQSNSRQLLQSLQRYFQTWLHASSDVIQQLSVIAIDSPVLEIDRQFTDWRREPGKTGRKDAIHDLGDDTRILLKVRTGMLFLQSQCHKIAVGPCLLHDNQLINFINSQYMNWLQHNDYLIAHAAALVVNGSVLAIAGGSGGGKSTLMLHLLETQGSQFLSNDRLFLRHEGDRIIARGIPKWPRINPGTLLNNPRLAQTVDQSYLEQWQHLPEEQLWQLEDKHDVDITTVYGKGRVCNKATLATVVVLNWRRGETMPTRMQKVAITEKPELVQSIMKSPGPFFQYQDGRLFQDTQQLDHLPYIKLLQNVAVYEVTGRLDFAALKDLCQQLIAVQATS